MCLTLCDTTPVTVRDLAGWWRSVTPGTLLLVVTSLVVVIAWLGDSWWRPFKACPACKGRSGRGMGSTRKAYNRCWRCKGNPELVRRGARLISSVTGRPVRGKRK
jgi:hypothetical protein